MSAADHRLFRLEFAPLRLERVGDLTVEYDERFSTVRLYIDGVPLADVRVHYHHEHEGEVLGQRHALEVTPYRTGADWDAGPILTVNEPTDPPNYRAPDPVVIA